MLGVTAAYTGECFPPKVISKIVNFHIKAILHLIARGYIGIKRALDSIRKGIERYFSSLISIERDVWLERDDARDILPE